MAQYMADGIDQKAVAGHVLRNLKSATSYAELFNNDNTADLGKRTSTVVVRVKPTVTLANTPADRDGLLARTTATSTSVEVSLDQDKYAKLALDSLNVEPDVQEAELGEAIAEASIAAGNADLLAELGTAGTQKYFGETFGASSTGDEVWASILEGTANEVATYTPEFTMFVGASFWARLASGVAALRTSVDPASQAASLAGVQRVIRVPDAQMPSGKLAIVAHRGSAVQPKVLTDLVTNREDADQILFYRVKFGSETLDAGAVVVINDGAEPEA